MIPLERVAGAAGVEGKTKDGVGVLEVEPVQDSPAEGDHAVSVEPRAELDARG